VSASRSETGPLTVVEAMSCGCPTVALRAPGFEDRIADGVNGLLAEDRPGELGASMARVLADPGLRSRLSAGAAERAPRYAPAAVTDRMLTVYVSLLA
jgi:glycosyltransferase involved in cell wall biosynthesis